MAYVDGVPQGNPVYNNYRSDIATLFPGYSNSNGAIGYYYIDTTALQNGVHTIAWSVTDSCNRSDGIGSRYFTVTNIGGVSAPTQAQQPDAMTSNAASAVRRVETLSRAVDGKFTVDLLELDRLELAVDATEGHLIVGKAQQSLPIGSTLKDGVFYWQLGPGFVGEYRLSFQRPDGGSVQLRVVVHPKN